MEKSKELTLNIEEEVNVFDILNDIDRNTYDIENKDTQYSIWFEQGSDYIPGVNCKTVQKIPSGVYKIVFERDDYHVKPYSLNMDEIYTFSEDFTTDIINEVEKFWDRADIYKKHKVSHKRGILLEGPAGNGKTSLISLLIKQLIKRDGLVFLVNSIKDFELLFNSLSTIIRQIEPNRPVITVIEDIDKLIDAMGGNDSEFLDFMDGKNSIEHHIIIMTSNDTSELSEALLRPSRIDMRFVLPEPSDIIRREFLTNKGLPTDLLDEYVDKTEGMSFAELKEVFISTQVLDKDIDKVIDQINNPLESRDYLSQHSKKLKL